MWVCRSGFKIFLPSLCFFLNFLFFIFFFLFSVFSSLECQTQLHGLTHKSVFQKVLLKSIVSDNSV